MFGVKSDMQLFFLQLSDVTIKYETNYSYKCNVLILYNEILKSILCSYKIDYFKSRKFRDYSFLRYCSKISPQWFVWQLLCRWHGEQKSTAVIHYGLILKIWFYPVIRGSTGLLFMFLNSSLFKLANFQYFSWFYLCQFLAHVLLILIGTPNILFAQSEDFFSWF